MHGRLCSKNIFLEHKIQLSLLDYAVGQSNTVYTSPQLLDQIEGGTFLDEFEQKYHCKLFLFLNIIFTINTFLTFLTPPSFK